jgi:hypothetical protein
MPVPVGRVVASVQLVQLAGIVHTQTTLVPIRAYRTLVKPVALAVLPYPEIRISLGLLLAPVMEQLHD